MKPEQHQGIPMAGGTRRVRRLPVAKRDRLLGLLYELSTGLGHAENVRELASRAFDLLGEHLGWSTGAVFVRGGEHESHLELVHAAGLPEEFTRRMATLPIDESTDCGAAVLRGEVRFRPVSDGPYERLCGADLSYKSSISLPLEGRGRNVGLLVVFTDGAAEQELAPWLRSGLPAVSQVIGLALANALLMERVDEADARVSRADARGEELTAAVESNLREPLRRAEALARTLAEDFSPHLPPAGHELLEALRESVSSVQPLIDGFVSVAQVKPEPGLRVVVDMEDLGRRVCDQLAASDSAKGAELKVRGHLPRAVADVHRVESVVSHLVENGLRHNRSKKRRVEVGSVRVQMDGQVQPLSAAVNTYFVRDNGVGIPAEYCNAVFGLFRQLQQVSNGAGTGAGLAIVRRIIEAEGGRIWVESTPGKGSTFYFTLPAAAEDA